MCCTDKPPGRTGIESCVHLPLRRDKPEAAGLGGVKDLALLCFELGIGEHTGIPEFAKLFELGKLVVRARGGGRLSVLRLGVLRLRCGGWGLVVLVPGEPTAPLGGGGRVRLRRRRFPRQLRCGRPREGDLAWNWPFVIVDGWNWLRPACQRRPCRPRRPRRHRGPRGWLGRESGRSPRVEHRRGAGPRRRARPTRSRRPGCRRSSLVR